MDKLYIVIPAYNEEENIDRLISDWYPVIEKHNRNGESRLVVVNDGSKDSTLSILQKYAAEKKLLKPLTKPNGGHGSAVLYGYRYAIYKEADYVFQTDSDGQTDPAEFEKFWVLRTSCDAIIGERKGRQDGMARVLVEKVLLLILRVIFGVRMPDSNAPFRLMKRELLEKYIGRMPKNYNLPNVMLSTFFVYYKENVRFLHISFKPRQAGTNSVNLKKIAKIGWKAMADFMAFRRRM